MTSLETSFSGKSLQWLKNAVWMFLKSSVGRRAVIWGTTLIVLILCINAMNVFNSYVLRYFMSAIEMRDRTGFQHYAWTYAGVFAVSTIIAVIYRFAEERLGLLWRSWMTLWLTDAYINGRVYLHAQEDQTLSNPDQRITEDVKALTTTTLSFVLMIFNSTITIISFSSVLWSISPALFLVAIAYALVGSYFTVLLGRPLIRLNYEQQDYEANFRSSLIRVREAADGIALSGYEGIIKNRLDGQIDKLIGNTRKIISINRNLGFLTTGYNYMIQLIPILLVAPLFINHEASFGVIGQSAMAFSTLVAALSLIVSQFQSISNYASVLTRLVEFSETADNINECRNGSCVETTARADHFVFQNLTLRSLEGDGSILVNNLNATIEPGQNVLVTSPQRGAKKALFLAAAGMHVPGTGQIERPPEGKAIFLTEKAFLPPCRLRDLLNTSSETPPATDTELHKVLQEVGLDLVIEKLDDLDSSRNWHDVLSHEEEQLMAIARTIISKPSFVFLDNLTAALGDNMEREMLRLFAAHDITCVAMGSSARSSGFFEAWLQLRADGSWTWTDLKHELKSQAE